MESNGESEKVLEEIKNILLEVDQMNDSNNEKIVSLIDSQTKLLLAVQHAGRQSRLSIRKEIRQLQGLIISIAALAVFFFGYSSKHSREDFLQANGQELMALLLAGLGGYRVMRSDKNSDMEEDITPSI